MEQSHTTPTENLLPRLRPEIESYTQIYNGQPCWVYKDPLSLRYYRFNSEEHFIIEKLRKGITLDGLKAIHQDRFKGAPLTNKDIGLFISSLLKKNLLHLTHPERHEILFKSGRARARKKLLGKFTSFLYIKIPLWDPDRFFDRIFPHIRFFWTKTFFAFYLLFFCVALAMIFNQWNTFTEMFRTQFFTIYNIPILLVSLWLVKAIHEFGHGLTCKNYGGEVHEVGFLFLVFMPMLYCNVTDSWRFPNKAHRLLTTAGGILVEIFIASLAAVVWYYTESPGFLNTFAFNIIVICSIHTVMMNAMPLMRFDGYYFLMDLIEVPNLQQRSSKYLQNLFVKNILGGHMPEKPEDHRYRNIFPLYAISSFIYRWFIVFAIAFTILGYFKQIGLEFFGRVFLFVTITMTLLTPLMKTGVMLTRQRRVLGISRLRTLMLLAAVSVILGGVLFFPLSQHVTLNFILEPARLQYIRPQADGILRWQPAVARQLGCESSSDAADSHFSHALWLEADEPLAELTNHELAYRQAELESEIQNARIQLDQAVETGNTNLIEQLRKRLNTYSREKQRVEDQIRHLRIRAPFAGEILSETEMLRMHHGRYIERADPLLLFADTRKLEAKVWVQEKTYARIFKHPDHVGQSAELLLYAFSDQPFRGKVTHINLNREEDMGEFKEKYALSNKAGGEVLTEYDPVTEKEKPVETAYEVTIALEDETLEQLPVRPYMSGRVRIECGKYTLYQWGRDSLLRLISPDIRL